MLMPSLCRPPSLLPYPSMSCPRSGQRNFPSERAGGIGIAAGSSGAGGTVPGKAAVCVAPAVLPTARPAPDSVEAVATLAGPGVAAPAEVGRVRSWPGEMV